MASAGQPPAKHSSPIPEPDGRECRAVLERVLASRHLRRSERLRDFLQYVCDRALTEPGRELHETNIGHNVFGRPVEYDTSQDNIVRVNASDLRRRLTEYFQNEGASEPVVIELPRGTYHPRFVQRPIAVPSPAPPPVVEQVVAPPEEIAAAPAPAVSSPLSKFTNWWIPAIAFLIGGVAVWAIGQITKKDAPSAEFTESADSAIREFWDPLLNNGHKTDIILADSNLSLYLDLTRESLTLDEYLRRDYLTRQPQQTKLARPELEMLMRRRYTSVADARLVNQLSWVVRPPNRPHVEVRFARDYPAADLRKANVIIIGSHRSNPWAELFEKNMDFRLDYDPGAGSVAVRNLKPSTGELPSYVASGSTADTAESYAVVSLLPNQAGGSWALLLSGTGMDATLAAGELTTSSRWLVELAARLKMPKGQRAPFFEVLLYTKRLAGSIGDIEVKALHVHPASSAVN